MDHRPIKVVDSTWERTMHTPNHGLLYFIKRLLARLAIGQILREEYLYEVHGPFVAVASVRRTRSFSKRLTDKLSASIRGLAYWSHLHRKATNARHSSE
jgi:hypothetical protein